MAFNREGLELLNMIVNKKRQSNEADHQRAFQERMQRNQNIQENYRFKVQSLSNEIAQSKQELNQWKTRAFDAGLEFGQDSEIENLSADFTGSLYNQVQAGQERIQSMEQAAGEMRKRLGTFRTAQNIASNFSVDNPYLQTLAGESEGNIDSTINELIENYGIDSSLYGEEQAEMFQEDAKRGFLAGISGPVERAQEEAAASQQQLNDSERRIASREVFRGTVQEQGRRYGSNSMEAMSSIPTIGNFRSLSAPNEDGSYDKEEVESMQNEIALLGTDIADSVIQGGNIEFETPEARARFEGTFADEFSNVLTSNIIQRGESAKRVLRAVDEWRDSEDSNISFPEYLMKNGDANTLAVIASYASNTALGGDRQSVINIASRSMANAIAYAETQDVSLFNSYAGEGQGENEARRTGNQQMQEVHQRMQENQKDLELAFTGIDAFEQAFREANGRNADGEDDIPPAGSFGEELSRVQEQSDENYIETGVNNYREMSNEVAFRYNRELTTSFNNNIGKISRLLGSNINEERKIQGIQKLMQMKSRMLEYLDNFDPETMGRQESRPGIGTSGVSSFSYYNMSSSIIDNMNDKINQIDNLLQSNSNLIRQRNSQTQRTTETTESEDDETERELSINEQRQQDISRIVDVIGRIESGDDPTQISDSGAGGQYQFTRSTWNSIMRQNQELLESEGFEPIYINSSGRELVENNVDNNLQRRMAELLTEQNARIIGSREPELLYSAHFMGTGFTRKVIDSNDDELVWSLLTQNQKRNIRNSETNSAIIDENTTVADYREWLSTKIRENS